MALYMQAVFEVMILPITSAMPSLALNGPVQAAVPAGAVVTAQLQVQFLIGSLPQPSSSRLLSFGAPPTLTIGVFGCENTSGCVACNASLTWPTSM